MFTLEELHVIRNTLVGQQWTLARVSTGAEPARGEYLLVDYLRAVKLLDREIGDQPADPAQLDLGTGCSVPPAE